MKVKLFHGYESGEKLEQDINDFIASNKFKTIQISFGASFGPVGFFHKDRFSALVLYE
jgi:hypothetical protein